MIGLFLAVSLPALSFTDTSKANEGACIAICNHWSYTGIGWQLGLESDVLSVVDAMELYDRSGVKTCIDMDTRAYERMASSFPEVVKRLSKYLQAGHVELIGGTYGQPMGTMFSGESDIRQIVYGLKTIQSVFGYRPTTFLNEEEFTFPQLPQILKGARFKYASLAQLDTWGKAGCPVMETNAVNWQGKDGTIIPTTPENALFRGGLYPGYELSHWQQTSSSPAFQKLKSQGKPMFVGWEEFGWESQETPAYETDAAAYRDLAAKAPIEYVTLTDYMRRYGAHPKDTVKLKMDDWTKSLTWGLGGDQLRIYNNQVEAKLSSAERFDAVASSMGLKSQAGALEFATKDFLASQSHDAGLCEYSRWEQDRMAPLDRLEDLHNFTWGALGYKLLDSANGVGNNVLDSALRFIASKTDSHTLKGAAKICTVFNPSFWARTDVVQSGRIYPIPANIKDVVVRDRTGNVVPSQLVGTTRDHGGNLVVTNVEFLAKEVPSLGYDTYSLSFSPKSGRVASDLKADQQAFQIENRFLRIKLDPTTGAVSSLIDKRSGMEMLRSQTAEYPVFKGKPNSAYPLRRNIPAEYDSSKAKAQLLWTECGPVRCTVRAHYNFAHLVYETHISLSADQPFVDVTTRVLSEVPPKNDDDPKEIKEGYWLGFAPAFKPQSVIRDYPLGIEASDKQAFHALSFVDLAGNNSGLLVLHPGTQYFRFEPDGSLSNLVMREWESYYSAEFGWPRYAEYHHALQPHGPNFTNAERLRASTGFTEKLIPLLGTPKSGQLPSRKSFIQVSPAGVQLSEFRRKSNGEFEVRAIEVEGAKASARITFSIPMRAAQETDLLGSALRSVPLKQNCLIFAIQPWKFETLSMK